MKKVLLSLFLLVLSFLMVGCPFYVSTNSTSTTATTINDSSSTSSSLTSSTFLNPSVQTQTMDNVKQLVQSQNILPERTLVDYAFEDTKFTFIHKIGTISGAFVGYLAGSMYYNGSSTATIEYQQSDATTVSSSYSVSNLLSLSLTKSISVSSEFQLPTVGSVAVEVGYSRTWTGSVQNTYGRSFSEMLQNTSSYAYTVNENMGAGYYTIVGFTRYSVYQITEYDLKTEEVTSTSLSYTQSPDEPSMDIYLVKASSSSDFSSVLEGVQPVLNVIELNEEDIQTCIDYAKTHIESEYLVVFGKEILYNDLWFSSSYSSYAKLDSIKDVLTTGNVKVDILKLFFNTMTLDLNYSYHSNKISNVRIQMKVVDKDSGSQMGETPEHQPDGKYSISFSLSGYDPNHNYIIEVRQRKIDGWGDGGIRFYKDREYTIVFS